LVTQLSNLGKQTHLFGDIVANPPEVDDIAAAAKLWRCFHEQDSGPNFCNQSASIGSAMPASLRIILMDVSFGSNDRDMETFHKLMAKIERADLLRVSESNRLGRSIAAVSGLIHELIHR
jgi:hypothetical protein